MNALTFQTAQSADGAVVLTPAGSAGMEAGESLDRELKKVGIGEPRHVVLDLARVEYISSVCIGVIVRFSQAVKGWGGRLSVAVPPGGMIDGTLRHAALDRVLHIEPSVAVALAAPPPPSA